MGEYVLAEDDVLGVRKFEDGIGRSAWPIERHVRGGETLWRFLERGSWYTIPYRCLVPRGVDNLLVAGRCISTDRQVNGSTRIMACCLNTGEAAGMAAAMALKQDTDVRAVNTDTLRTRLKEEGAYLP